MIRLMRADLYKLKGNAVLIMHIVIPILVSAVFLAYYKVSAWSEGEKIAAFYELIGCCFPILIGIFSASIMEQESAAGNFQNLLTLKAKTRALLSKVMLLMLMGLAALLITSLIFGIGFNMINSSTLGAGPHIMAALIIWFAGIPCYLWNMITALKLGRGASIGAGIFTGLINALFLTEIGSIVWPYVPFAWTARMVSEYLTGNGRSGLMIAYPVVTVLSIVAYVITATGYEGTKITE